MESNNKSENIPSCLNDTLEINCPETGVSKRQKDEMWFRFLWSYPPCLLNMLVFKTITWSYKSILAIKNFTGFFFHVKVSTNIRNSGKRTLKFSNFCICLLFTKGAMRQEDQGCFVMLSSTSTLRDKHVLPPVHVVPGQRARRRRTRRLLAIGHSAGEIEQNKTSLRARQSS